MTSIRFILLIIIFFNTASWAENNSLTVPYPNKPLRFIVPYPPGGGNDFIARVIAVRLGDVLRQQVIVDNRAGAHGIIATELTAKAPPDGHTFMLSGTGHAINPVIYKNLPYDSERDFSAVTLAAVAPNLLVIHPAVAATTVRELIGLAKANPRQLNFASVGAGGNSHLAGELFKLRANVEIMHVPYRGTGPASTALLAGEVQMIFSTLPPALSQVRIGKLRAIALTSSNRSTVLPDIPTISESGLPGYEATGWWGVLAPANTPKVIVLALNTALLKVLRSEDTKVYLFKEGIEAAGGTPEQFKAHILSERQKWAKVIQDAKLKLD